MIIYLPGQRGPDVGVLERFGLGALLADGDNSPDLSDCVAQGPDGSSGLLVRFGAVTDPPEAWEPKAQAWTGPIEQPGTPGPIYLGKLPGQTIQPGSLARRRLHAGDLLTMADGHDWLIPMARQLPHVLGLGAPRIRDPYKPFYEAAARACDQWQQVSDESIGWAFLWSDGFALACQALAINYRVAPAIVDWLGLVSSELLTQIVAIVTDGAAQPVLKQKLIAWLEKKKADAEATPTEQPSPEACGTAAGETA